MAKKSIWTDERTEQLKKLHNQGWSYVEIANFLGNGLTRNAIIGKVDRMRRSGAFDVVEKTKPIIVKEDKPKIAKEPQKELTRQPRKIGKNQEKTAKRNSPKKRSKKADPARVERRKKIIADMAGHEHMMIAKACGWNRMSDLKGFCNKHGVELKPPVTAKLFRDWPVDKKVSKLRALVDSGSTNKEIAAEIEYTVKSVQRILARHGIKRNQPSVASKPLPKRQPTKPERSNQVSNIDASALLSTDLVTIDDLSQGQCKWPIGNPGDDDFGFCGDRQKVRSSYCDAHAKKAKR